MPEDQKYIYYCSGNSILSIKKMPQVEKVLSSGYDVLCMTDNVDEFAIKYIVNYNGKEFKNVTDGDNGLDSESEETKEEDKPILEFIKNSLDGEVLDVKFASNLGNHPVCLLAQGEVSIEMEKVLRNMPNTDANQDIRAKKILQINREHKIFEKIKTLFESDKDSLKEISRVLLDEAKLIEGLPVDDIASFVELATKYISK